MFSVIRNSVDLDAVKLDAFYLVKLIFGKYFRYFDENLVADLLQLHLQLEAICVLVRERVNRHRLRILPKGCYGRGVTVDH